MMVKHKDMPHLLINVDIRDFRWHLKEIIADELKDNNLYGDAELNHLIDTADDMSELALSNISSLCKSLEASIPDIMECPDSILYNIEHWTSEPIHEFVSIHTDHLTDNILRIFTDGDTDDVMTYFRLITTYQGGVSMFISNVLVKLLRTITTIVHKNPGIDIQTSDISSEIDGDSLLIRILVDDVSVITWDFHIYLPGGIYAY